jgi:hypothetical protein
MGYSLIALGQWMLDGYRNYGAAGFARASASWPPTALDVDLSTQTHIVTGANAGLGFEMALALAKRRAHVYAVCRDATRGRDAVDRLLADAGPGPSPCATSPHHHRSARLRPSGRRRGGRCTRW